MENLHGLLQLTFYEGYMNAPSGERIRELYTQGLPGLIEKTRL